MSNTNWEGLRAMADDAIQLTPEHPEADGKHMIKGIVRHGLKPVSSTKQQD